MNYYQILKITGIILIIFSLFLIVPIIVAYLYDESIIGFIKSLLIILITGFIFFYPNRYEKSNIRIKEGFLIVAIFWIILSIFGALPFLLDDTTKLSLVDSVFESTSGWTTTGATIITNIDDLSKSILMYRQLLQWLGGIGIVVLVLAILPILGVGGMYLYRAETSSPVKDNKLSPRITETAKNLWSVYLILTISCIVFYYIAGMNLYDAIGHSFSTVSIGGFSTHNASIGFYDNNFIKITCMVFMFLSALNFILHFLFYKNRTLLSYYNNSEFKTYVLIIISITILSLIFLSNTSNHIGNGVDILFQILSFVTTSGFTTTDYSSWPMFLIVLFFISSFIGACAGSAGGGMKVIRIAIALKSIKKQLLKVVHPKAEISIKVNDKKVDDITIETILSFIVLYILIFFVSSLLLMLSGHDLVTSFSSSAACLNNLGPALGDAMGNYSSLNDFSKMILSIVMVVGRLEIYTFIILLTRYFWKY